MLAVILCSLLIGAILAIVAQALLLRKWFFSLPVTGPPKRSQFDRFSLPKVRSRKLLNIYTNNLNDMILLLPPLLVNDGLNFFSNACRRYKMHCSTQSSRRRRKLVCALTLFSSFCLMSSKTPNGLEGKLFSYWYSRVRGLRYLQFLKGKVLQFFLFFIWHLLKKIRNKLVKAGHA